jgi:hypothetical protein
MRTGIPRALVWSAIIALLVCAYALYKSRGTAQDLNVDPHAAREIEKAKRR